MSLFAGRHFLFWRKYETLIQIQKPKQSQKTVAIPTHRPVRIPRLGLIQMSIQSPRLRLSQIPIPIQSLRLRLSQIRIPIQSLRLRLSQIPIPIQSLRLRLSQIPIPIQKPKLMTPSTFTPRK